MDEFDSKRQEMASDATLRDYFAAKAMQGVLSGADPLQSVVNIATRAYAIADAMLKARE